MRVTDTHDRNVLNAYLESFRLCESENINKRVLSLVELFTCHFLTMSELKLFLLQDGFPKLESLDIFWTNLTVKSIFIFHFLTSIGATRL